jgi:hypothetical protein
MSEFEEDREALTVEQLTEELIAANARHLTEYTEGLRKTGYAEYDWPRWKLRRIRQRLMGEEVMTREKWNSFVDQAVEKAAKMVF